MEHISTILPTYLDNLLYKIWRADRDYWQQFTYKKPVYELPEVSKAFLKDVIKQLRQQCYEINDQKIQINQDETIPEWLKQSLIEELSERHNKLLRRIKDYNFRIKYGSGSNAVNPRSITESDKQRAKERPISDYYTGKLRKTGVRLLGKCPFHSEKTASFVVYPNNTWHCFGCNEHGDVIDFIKKTNNLSFIEAIKYLCNKTNGN